MSKQQQSLEQQPEAAESAEVGEPADSAGSADAAGDDDSPARQAAPPTIESLQHELAAAQQQAEEHWSELLRARAEVENMRKRAERDVENAHKYGLERFLTELLPVKDSLELGLSAAATAQDVETVTEGIELTLKMLTTALDKHGVTMIDPAGEKFDPELHQAVSMVESTEAEPGTVMNVIQRGYTLNERLVRPAMVTVAKKTTDTSA
jgi:molecular chaperone GrpE